MPSPTQPTTATGPVPVHLVDEPAVQIVRLGPAHHLVDFGRVAFGNLRVQPAGADEGACTVHFGESLVAGRVDRTPPGTVRYGFAPCQWSGTAPVVVAPPPDLRNTWTPGVTDSSTVAGAGMRRPPPPAILTPPEWGVVIPFRWVEIDGGPDSLSTTQVVRQAAYAASWRDDAASFACSEPLLDQIWDLCRHTIKATTFAGLYVDGDRERIPYEADAYLNQLSHYATEGDPLMARATFDHLMAHPTWPTEWATHMVFMAHADWWHTGDRPWLAARYESLKAKLLLDRVGEDDLVYSNAGQIAHNDLVDWPPGERDGFVFTACNAAINAFYLRGLATMAELAEALGHAADADEYRCRWSAGREAFHRAFFDPDQGRYRDGMGTEHTSLHASLLSVAFGLAPAEVVPGLIPWLTDRGMACSVYMAQYYLEALWQHGAGAAALRVITAAGDRSWRHMIEQNATLTWEAWDMKYKPNQDWNHAWGAAPGNLLPRFVLGVTPARPGWSRAKIAPCPGHLEHASGRVPTPRGDIEVAWNAGPEFCLRLNLPDGIEAEIELPASLESEVVDHLGQPLAATRRGDRWVLPGTWRGAVELSLHP